VITNPIPGVTMVDHCNARTEYEMITHPYDPDTCSECHICAMIILTGDPFYSSPAPQELSQSVKDAR
jgi:hypothetical protein